MLFALRCRRRQCVLVGDSALRLAERLVARDAAPAAGAAPPTAAQREQHKTIVAMLKGHGAT